MNEQSEIPNGMYDTVSIVSQRLDRGLPVGTADIRQLVDEVVRLRKRLAIMEQLL